MFLEGGQKSEGSPQVQTGPKNKRPRSRVAAKLTSAHTQRMSIFYVGQHLKFNTHPNIYHVVCTLDSTYWFQCSLETRYRLLNMMGRILSMFSSIRLRMYSLFQKYSDRSATCTTQSFLKKKFFRFSMRWAVGSHYTQYTLMFVSNYSLSSLTFLPYRQFNMRNGLQWRSPWLVRTWKWGLATHLEICLNSSSWIFLNCVGSMTSRISSISPRNMTYAVRWSKHDALY